MKILLVEDEPPIRRLYKEVLVEMGGHTVHDVSRIADAVLVFDREHVDCVVTDHNVFDGTTSDMIRMMRIGRPDVRIVGMSGDPVREEMLAAGCDTFISKPIMPLDALLSAVEK